MTDKEPTVGRKGVGMRNQQNEQQEWMEQLCISTWKEIYRFVYYKVQNREEAEDITQETYARALSYLNKSDSKVSDYTNYLKTISINIIRDKWRAKMRRGDRINIEELHPEIMATKDFSDDIGEQEELREAMQQLTKDQQTVIALRIIKGYSSAETAKMMKKKEATVRVMQYRALKALAKILQA